MTFGCLLAAFHKYCIIFVVESWVCWYFTVYQDIALCVGILVQLPIFWTFLIFPMTLFVLDKLISLSRNKTEISIVKAELLPSGELTPDQPICDYIYSLFLFVHVFFNYRDVGVMQLFSSFCRRHWFDLQETFKFWVQIRPMGAHCLFGPGWWWVPSVYPNVCTTWGPPYSTHQSGWSMDYEHTTSCRSQ